METKVCADCEREQPLSEYHFHRRPDSKGSQVAICRTRSNEKRRARRVRDVQVFRQMIASAQVNGCVVCGESDPIVLHFHHVNPAEKDCCIADWLGRWKSRELFDAELAKCVVVCMNCHLRIHAGTIRIEVVTVDGGRAYRVERAI